MKQRFTLIILTSFTIILAFVHLSSCKKETSTPVCDARGIYTGTNTPSDGVSSTVTFNLKENNIAIGSVTPTSASATFGGYRSTCDSVILSVFYTSNFSYYLFQGKLLNNGTTISGTFKNLNTSESGTFTISK